jgi:hypothetical protein
MARSGTALALGMEVQTFIKKGPLLLWDGHAVCQYASLSVSPPVCLSAGLPLTIYKQLINFHEIK